MRKRRMHGQPKPAPPKIYTVREPAELLPFLAAHLPNTGRNSVKSLLKHGQVTVDGQVETVHNTKLHPGQNVSVDKKRPDTTDNLIGLKILYEDRDLIVVHKEAGLLSMASPQERELTAYRQLSAHIRGENPGGRIFIVHRLDRDTSGVMMFAKSQAVQQKLQNSWKESVKERIYIALVEGEVKQREGTVSSWLKESSTLKMYASSKPNGGKHAVTHYKVLRSNRKFSLLEVRLETGRKNQIRVHMQELGHPVAGDKKYGSSANPAGRLGLHAQALAFIHPATGKQMRFESEIPASFWKVF